MFRCSAGSLKDCPRARSRTAGAPALAGWESRQSGEILPADNAKLGIPERRSVTRKNKAKELGDKLDWTTDAHVRRRRKLQAAFGLRREDGFETGNSVFFVRRLMGVKSSRATLARIRVSTPCQFKKRRLLSECSRRGGGILILKPCLDSAP
jgi:hypothetical protein